MTKNIKINVRMTESDYRLARGLGNNNISAGIRKCIEIAKQYGGYSSDDKKERRPVRRQVA